MALEAACILKSPGCFVSLLVYIARSVTERDFLAGGGVEAHAFLPVFPRDLGNSMCANRR